MSKSSAATLSPTARGYVSIVAAVGITLGLYCIYSLFREGVPVELLVFSALTLLSGRIIIDTFLRAYERFMPTAEEAAHPIIRTIGEPRASLTEGAPPVAPATSVPAAEAPATSEVLAVASPARAMAGEADLPDVGALTWMVLGHAVPSESMTLFGYDKLHNPIAADYTAGVHADAIHGRRLALGAGGAGWSAANRFVLNADPALDLDRRVAEGRRWARAA